MNDELSVGVCSVLAFVAGSLLFGIYCTLDTKETLCTELCTQQYKAVPLSAHWDDHAAPPQCKCAYYAETPEAAGAVGM